MILPLIYNDSKFSKFNNPRAYFENFDKSRALGTGLAIIDFK
jgi:hypothetical protein